MSNGALTQPRVLIPFLIVSVIWGSTWFVIHDQLGVVPATWSVAYRFAIAAIVMFAWALVTRQRLVLGARGQAFAVVLGTFQFVLNFNLVYRAEDRITSGLVAVVFALLLVPNAIFGRIALKQPVTARFMVGSAIALAGVAMLIVEEARRDPSSAGATWTGVGLTVLAILSASIANVMQGSAAARSRPMVSMLAWAMLWGAAINAGFALATAGPPVIELRAGYLLGTAYLGVVASAIAFTLYFGVIRAIGPARAAYSSVLTPVLAMILSTLFERYHWTWLAAAGGVVAMAGLLVALGAKRA